MIYFIKNYSDKIKMLYILSLIFMWIVNHIPTQARSVFRRNYSDIPSIEAYWEDNNSKTFFLRKSYLQEKPFFQIFDKDFFESRLLPEGDILYRNSVSKYIPGKRLTALIEHLLFEISLQKKEFSNFTILRKRDFNFQKQAGLLVLQFKEYPFVVKLFMETPQSFVDPFAKGLVPTLFFNMSGGINRHLLGFTRIKNIEQIHEKIKTNPFWSKKIDMPRKWFWQPQQSKHIRLVGKNIGNKDYQTIDIPGTYAIIADAITPKGKKLSILHRKERKTCMSLANFLELSIDPHIDNFIIEKETDKLVIIDTENFLAMMGDNKKRKFKGYVSWICNYAVKYINDMLFRPKHNKKC